MLSTHRILVLAMLGMVLACHRQKQPSQDYAEASQAFTALYAQKLDDAFSDPQMAAIEAQLKRVPSDSLDAPAATDLLQRIEAGKAKARARQQELDKSLAAAEQPPREPDFAPRPAGATDDGGSSAASAAEPKAGMSMGEFTQRFSDCFQPGGPIEVKGRGMADTWVLKSEVYCSDKHPGFAQSLVVTDGSTILGVFARSSVSYPDAGAGAH